MRREEGVTVIAVPYGQSRAFGACRLRGQDERGDAPALLTYARRFNKRLGRTGHLFQNRFDRRSLDTDWQVMEAIRSVHADPQEAGISLIERYPWSSFAEHLCAYDGDAADVARGFPILLACLSSLVLPRALLPIRFRRPTAVNQRCAI